MQTCNWQISEQTLSIASEIEIIENQSSEIPTLLKIISIPADIEKDEKESQSMCAKKEGGDITLYVQCLAANHLGLIHIRSRNHSTIPER
jgi:hypothetical protein